MEGGRPLGPPGLSPDGLVDAFGGFDGAEGCEVLTVTLGVARFSYLGREFRLALTISVRELPLFRGPELVAGFLATWNPSLSSFCRARSLPDTEAAAATMRTAIMLMCGVRSNS